MTNAQDFWRPSPTVQALAECLASLIGHNEAGAPKPSLILNGDVLDLALHPEEQTLAAFEEFLRAMMPPNDRLFGEIIYIPGNHDHHMWTSARDAQYAQYLDRLEAEETPESPWETTKVVMDCHGKDHLVNAAVTAIARRIPHLRQCKFEILTAYPNFGIEDGGGRAVVFHHGHFIEPAYHFFSTLGTLLFPKQALPSDVYALERENGAWIDFLWSALGSSGRIGGDIECIYDASTKESSLLSLADTLAHSVSKQFPYPKGVPRFLREWVAKMALQEVARHCTRGLERCQAGGGVLSPDAAQGLHWYIEGPLRKQLEVETGRIPDSLTFVLGHTHKPGEQAWDHTAVLNTGGWVVDAPEPQSLHGATAVLVSDDLSAVSLRLYNEGCYTPRLAAAPGEPAAHTNFFRQMSELVKTDAEPWKSWSAVSRNEVELRLANFAARMKKDKAVAVRV